MIILAACSDNDEETSSVIDESTGEDVEHGEIVRDIVINSSTQEANRQNYEAALMMQTQWEELGMNVSVEPLEFNTLTGRLYGDSQEFDVYTIGWSGRVERIDPDMFLYSIFHSSNTEPGGNNTTGYSNPAYDELADAQRKEMDPDERREIVFEAQQMLADEAPLITLYARDLYHAYNHERFTNMNAMPGEGIFSEWMPMDAEPLTDDATLRIASIHDLDTLNPLAANSVYEWRNLRLIYDKLIRLTPEGEPEPWAAESWDIVDDTTIDVTVRDGMNFHDGEPVTVEDVAFSYEYMIDWEVGYFLAFLNPIDTVEIVDDNTVRFTLNEPYAPFINNTLAQIPILPKHIWETIVEDEGLNHPEEFNNDEVIGSGPFTFEVWRRGEELRTARFDDHFYDVNIDGYIVDLYSQNEGVMTALETGDVDTNGEQFIPAHINQAESLAHLEMIEVPDIGYQYVSFNTRLEPFDDTAFRQAIAHTIDFDEILDVHLEGFGQRGGSGLVINEANEFWHNPDVERPEFDPERAREILSDAGYTWDEDGRLRMPNN